MASAIHSWIEQRLVPDDDADGLSMLLRVSGLGLTKKHAILIARAAVSHGAHKCLRALTPVLGPKFLNLRGPNDFALLREEALLTAGMGLAAHNEAIIALLDVPWLDWRRDMPGLLEEAVTCRNYELANRLVEKGYMEGDRFGEVLRELWDIIERPEEPRQCIEASSRLFDSLLDLLRDSKDVSVDDALNPPKRIFPPSWNFLFSAASEEPHNLGSDDDDDDDKGSDSTGPADREDADGESPDESTDGGGTDDTGDTDDRGREVTNPLGFAGSEAQAQEDADDADDGFGYISDSGLLHSGDDRKNDAKMLTTALIGDYGDYVRSAGRKDADQLHQGQFRFKADAGLQQKSSASASASISGRQHGGSSHHTGRTKQSGFGISRFVMRLLNPRST